MWATPPAGLCFSSTSTKSRNNSWGRQHTHTASHQLSPCLITHTLAVTLCSPFTHIFTHLSFSHFAHMYTHLHTFLFCFFSRPSHTLTHSQQFSLCPLSLSSSDTLFGRLLSDAGMSQREEGRGCVGDVSVTSTPLCLMRDTRQCWVCVSFPGCQTFLYC